jgi:ribose/xylose/arabinose/galactoside ABC-type transport system permease subunit
MTGTNLSSGKLTAAPTGSRAGNRLIRHRALVSSSTFVGFIIIFVVYWLWLGGRFINISARLLDIHSNATVFLLGLSALVTLIVGKFDLSVAGMATLGNFLVIGLVVDHGWPLWAALVTTIVVGAVGGLLNAWLVVGLGINTFIATLGTNGVFIGASTVFSSGSVLTATQQHPLPSWFSGDGSLGSFTGVPPSWLPWTAVALATIGGLVRLRQARPARIGSRVWDACALALFAAVWLIALFVFNLSTWVSDASWTIIVLLIIGLILWVFLQYTTIGRMLRATGGNSSAARLAGVPVARVTVLAYVLGGVIAGVVGILLAANLGSATPSIAEGFLLPAFTAAFLSTVLFSSGHFHVWGTIVGGTFLVWVGQGLIVGGLSYNWNDVVNGVVLIAAVALASIRSRQRT